jgi:hypothetical protein
MLIYFFQHMYNQQFCQQIFFAYPALSMQRAFTNKFAQLDKLLQMNHYLVLRSGENGQWYIIKVHSQGLSVVQQIFYSFHHRPLHYTLF